MNAEIVARLQDSFLPRAELAHSEIVAVVRATLDELARRDAVKKRGPPR